MRTCKIYQEGELLSEELVARLRDVPSAVISDQLGRTGAIAGVAPLGRDGNVRLAGRAFTVRTRPGDNLAVHMALEFVSPGDVLIVDAAGSTERAVAGEILCRHAAAKGVVGLVANGVVRDSAELASGPFPVFALGASHLGPFKDGPGELRGSIAPGGCVVRQGDAIVGDADGVVVIPQARIGEILEAGEKALAREAEVIALADAGKMDTAWLREDVNLEWVESVPN